MRRNVGELEICWLSKFQPPTTLGGRENAEKLKQQKAQKLRTLNGRLPPEQGSDWRETLGKGVLDNPQHLIFRR